MDETPHRVDAVLDALLPEGAGTCLALLYFWAPWCGPCRLLSPLVADLETRFRPDLRLLKLNVDTAVEEVAAFAVNKVPTLILVRRQAIVATRSGALTRSQLTQFLDTAFDDGSGEGGQPPSSLC